MTRGRVSQFTKADEQLQQFGCIETDQEKKDIQELFQKEWGFSQIVEYLIGAKKPIVGHSFIYDVTFFYHQFIDELPDNYPEFAAKWSAIFPETYDTKVLTMEAFETKGKTDLNHMYYKCTHDKKISNSLVFDFDAESDPAFGMYKQGGQEHDAGYDAYMTGHIFGCLSKWIEVRHIIAPHRSDLKPLPSGKTSVQRLDDEPERHLGAAPDANDLASMSSQDGGTFSAKKPIHYSTVQNKPVETSSIAYLRNKIMLEISLPRYFPLEMAPPNVVKAIKQKGGPIYSDGTV